ncbi:hypothetical protein Dimus_000185 [Dionaea muscipula]
MSRFSFLRRVQGISSDSPFATFGDLRKKMEYDYHRSRVGPPPYESRVPMYPTATSSAASSSPTSTTAAPHISSFYPKIGQPIIPPAGRVPPYHHPSSTSSSSSASPPSGTGIRVAIKQEYRITPPPQLSPQMVEIPRSNFQFDFDLEKKILAELEKEHPNWSRLGLEALPSRSTDSNPSVTTAAADPLVMKYIASGLNREAVPLAVANYGDNPAKVREFVNAFTLLREMGFTANNVVEGLLAYDNDTDKVLAHFLNSPSSS